MPTKPDKNNNALDKPKTAEEIRDNLSRSKTGIDPEIVLREADKELNSSDKSKIDTTSKGNLFKAMTLLEFENGVLMATAVPEPYQTFGIEMLRRLQQEFHCESVSEKATAELTTVNYIRTLAIQHHINSYLNKDSFTDLGVRYLAVMSKELDKANRHYLASVQALKAMKQSLVQLNIKTDTAIIGQNQVVQANNQ